MDGQFGFEIAGDKKKSPSRKAGTFFLILLLILILLNCCLFFLLEVDWIFNFLGIVALAMTIGGSYEHFIAKRPVAKKKE